MHACPFLDRARVHVPEERLGALQRAVEICANDMAVHSWVRITRHATAFCILPRAANRTKGYKAVPAGPRVHVGFADMAVAVAPAHEGHHVLNCATRQSRLVRDKDIPGRNSAHEGQHVLHCGHGNSQGGTHSACTHACMHGGRKPRWQSADPLAEGHHVLNCASVKGVRQSKRGRRKQATAIRISILDDKGRNSIEHPAGKSLSPDQPEGNHAPPPSPLRTSFSESPST